MLVLADALIFNQTKREQIERALIYVHLNGKTSKMEKLIKEHPPVSSPHFRPK